ncbi:MAG: polysaccharide deacetylase family protein [Oscillospiraceae bacterium]|nr:polysaccharide deacetylase family protein [Oscillospiraceae bacterium]
MSGKKWFVLFLAALASVFAAWALVNLAIDPFDAFGGGLAPWDSYSQTLAPRNAKVRYLSTRFDRYDSYVVGSSSAASYLPATLERYLGGSFYNMFHYGADAGFDRALVEYLLAHDDVRRIVLVLGVNEGNLPAETDESDLPAHAHYAVTGEARLRYDLRYLFAEPDYALEKLRSRTQDTILPKPFDVFVPESGVYDKRVRDVESIGSYEAYMEKNGGDFGTNGSLAALTGIGECAENVAAIREMCRDAGTELTVILSPVCRAQLEEYDVSSLDEYFRALAGAADYWNFAITPLTYDERFFYDATHTRNAAADMVLARVFGDESVYTPENFGVFCSGGASAAAEELMRAAAQVARSDYTATLPVLLYHHIQQEDGGEMCRETFERQMALLRDNGYVTVSLADAVAFVRQGRPLPERAVAVTFDDGYLSNYEYACPILRANGQRAAIFPIGCSIGHERYYKDTQFELTPHFGAREIAQMADVIDFGSHTYDMHQWAPYEPEGAAVRESVMPLPGESEDDFYRSVTADAEKMAQTFRALGLDAPSMLSFPNGKRCTEADAALAACGIKLTLTSDDGRINTLVAGLPQSLFALGRFAPTNRTTDGQLLFYLEKTAD